jgi:hypothetical protein
MKVKMMRPPTFAIFVGNGKIKDTGVRIKMKYRRFN